MGGATAGAKMGKSKEEGQELLDSFFIGFPAVATAISESKKFLRENGYVEDFYGRRRHLDEIFLPSYDFKPLDNDNIFNPFLNCNKPKPMSYSEKFWRLVIDWAVQMSQSYQKLKNKDWKLNAQMSNETYENWAKLALYPYMWKQPAKTQEEIESWINLYNEEYKKYKKDPATGNPNYYASLLQKYIRVKKTEGCLNGVLVTCQGFGEINSESTYNKVVVRKSISDLSLASIHILTNEEKFRSDIYEYLNVRLVNDQRLAAVDGREPYLDKIAITTDIQLPTEPILIIANTGRKAQAERQCFNARIQGGAATLTKLAMIDIANDKQMSDMHAKLIIPVHDELLVECPAYYADKVIVRLPELMVGAAKKGGIDIPQKCDPYCVDRWYADEMAALLIDEYTKLIKGDPKKNILPKSKPEALQILYTTHEEIPQKSILDVIEGRTPDEVVF